MTLALRLVLVTDRALMSASTPAAFAAAIDRALAAVPAGAAMVQVREKDLDGGALLAFATAAREAAHARGAILTVNDRVDVAVAAGADGVHLPEAGMDVGTARALLQRLAGRSAVIVGASRHHAGDAIGAGSNGADLVHLGPIWPTPKPHGLAAPLGVGELARARAGMARDTQLVAVGGVDSPSRAAEARAAGADVVAVIRAVWTATDPATAAAALL